MVRTGTFSGTGESFELKEKKEVVVLKINKAQFGTQVWINGKNAGEHFGCFTAGYFDITRFVKQPGRNEIVIRIGAHPKALPEWVPFGTDLEKRKWTPGIYDDVSVIACNNPYIETLQIAPDINYITDKGSDKSDQLQGRREIQHELYGERMEKTERKLHREQRVLK